MDYCIHCMEPLGTDLQTCTKCNTAQVYDSPLHHLKPGTVLRERYLLGRALGEGGFGITYIGRDLNLDMRIAVKEYYPNGCSNRNHDHSNTVTMTQPGSSDSFEKEMERFLHEARTLAKFSNEPGIVGVRDFFRENGTAYIVMEYLDGVTLKSYLTKLGTIPADKLFPMMEPVMQSLSRIHAQDLIHRDISPDNIMMLQNGQLKLLDFGAAREVKGDKSLSVMLKPGYAPEEQYRTKGKQGPWTDVYALCATMYKCITGVTPDESLERAYEDGLQLPSALGVPISPKQESVLMKGLAVRIGDRIQDMDTLRQGLMGKTVPEQTQSVHVQRPAEDEAKAISSEDDEKTRYQPTPEAELKTVYEQTKQAEKNPAVQPEKKPEEAPKETSKKLSDSPKQNPEPSKKAPKVHRTSALGAKVTAREKKRFWLVLIPIAAVLAVVLLLSMGRANEKVTTIPGDDYYGLTSIGTIEDEHRSMRFDNGVPQSSDDVPVIPQSTKDGSMVMTSYLGYGLCVAKGENTTPGAICTEVNRFGLTDRDGNVLIPAEACCIGWPYEQEDTDCRYLLAYYATGTTQDSSNFLLCQDQYGTFYNSAIEGGTLYNGYIRIFDRITNEFVKGLTAINDRNDVQICGSSIVIGNYQNGYTVYDSDGNIVLTTKGSMNVGDGTMIVSESGTWRVYDENGVQTYYANKAISMVTGSGYIKMKLDGSQYTLMDPYGNTVLDETYDDFYQAYGNKLVVKNGEKYGLITIEGNEIVSCKYRSIYKVSQGFGDYFRAQLYDDVYTLIGPEGIAASGLEYFSTLSIVENKKALVINDRTFDLDIGSNPYSNLTDALIAVSSKSNGLYGVYDLFTGEQLLPFAYEAIEYCGGRLYAYKSGVWEVYEINYHEA